MSTLLRTITNDDHLLDSAQLRLQLNADVFAGRHPRRAWLISNHGKLQHLAGTCIDSKRTGRIGAGAPGSPFHNDRGAA